MADNLRMNGNLKCRKCDASDWSDLFNSSYPGYATSCKKCGWIYNIIP